ncbi:GspH/FimT family pseudopilin [Pseudoalteromonas piscicida]|uniref:Type II secretion system protein H n=1 Tax=Pseudoalteromonas piscicida TaxID=43662 RepID=A0A2A5JT86_PSEO7|nr:GspH/FimT family pseudopilin [Pseudoalteromonas piscicida]PCK32549.1 pilus assembly protein [Pseudoalteromonas piscicida]
MRRQQGFSLLESMVCITIAIIVSYLSLPNLSSIFQFNRPQIKLEALRRAINFARIKAVANDATVTLCPLKQNRCNRHEWHQPLTVFVDYRPTGEFSGDDFKLAVFEATERGDKLTYPRQAIIFRRYGHLAGLYNGTFIYCNNANPSGLALSVSYTGRTTLKDTDKCKM